jgi:hypothetical protein
VALLGRRQRHRPTPSTRGWIFTLFQRLHTAGPLPGHGDRPRDLQEIVDATAADLVESMPGMDRRSVSRCRIRRLRFRPNLEARGPSMEVRDAAIAKDRGGEA